MVGHADAVADSLTAVPTADAMNGVPTKSLYSNTMLS
jgi:hypothetical protein